MKWNETLFWLVREKVQKKGYEFAWHKNGNSSIPKKAGGRVLKIGDVWDAFAISTFFSR